MTHCKVNRILLLLFVLLAVLAPSLRVAAGLPLLRPEMLVVGLAFAVRHSRPLFQGDVPRLLGAFGLTALVAIALSYTVFGVPYDGSDFSIFPMLVQYWLVYCFVAACLRRGVRSELMWFVAVAVAVSASVALMQKLNLFGVNSWLTPLYVTEESRQARSVLSLDAGNATARAIGTVGDPRHSAMMLGFGVAAVLSLLLGQRRGGGKWLLVLLLGVIASGMLVTYSRTGLLAAGGAAMVGLWLVVRRGGNVAVPLSIGMVSVIGVAAVSANLGVIEEDSRLTMNAGEAIETSGYARIRDTLEPFQKSLTNPLILITGMGPSKSVLPGSEHGETGWLVLRYGLVGFFLYLAMVKRASARSLRVIERGRAADAMMASFVLQGITVWMVFFLAESIFKLSQIMSMNMLVLSAAAGLGAQPEAHRHARPATGNFRHREARRDRDADPGRNDGTVTDPDLQL